jgi:hypothetical protein
LNDCFHVAGDSMETLAKELDLLWAGLDQRNLPTLPNFLGLY